MVEINGKQFENYESALEYLKKEKHREELECKYAERREVLNRHLNAAEVEYGGKKYLVCTLSTKENRELLPLAKIESLFGQKFQITENEVRQIYRARTVKNASICSQIEEYLLGSVKENEKKKCIYHAVIGENEYQTLFFYDMRESKPEVGRKTCSEMLDDCMCMLYGLV